MAAAKNPKTVTIYGRLSFPVFLHDQAVKKNTTSKFPKPADEVQPDFNLLVEQDQLDKLINHVTTEFLPYCLDQGKKGEKRDVLSAKNIKRITDLINSADWENQPPYLPIKVIGEKSQDLAPACVASIKVVGNRGSDIDLMAVVNSEDELAVPDPDLLSFPVLKPIGQTVHSMYPGCYVAATLNLYAYETGSVGFTASAGVAVFKADADRFGGGVAVDEDEIFAD